MVILTEASSSSSSNTLYDVFISFRGVDTRLRFVDHLHNALLEANLKTFLDEAEIDTGEDLRPELEGAIKASRASVIVLSPNYASSTWCLDELVLILEQRLTSDHLVIPIFYDVEPTHVKKQEGSFGDAMAVHRKKMEEETNAEEKSKLAQKIDRWKKALTEVAQLKGKDAKGRKETEFIDEIVTNIHRRLGGHLHSTLPLLFGREDSIESITSWLKDGSSHTADILTISGMGGVGKTSLARYVYGLHYRLFDKSSFIEGIGEKCASQGKIPLDIQKQLFSDILKRSQIQALDTLAYTSMIENGLNRKKVLIVLDDIDSVDQLHELLGKQGFHPGSKIIITTRDVSLPERYAPINPIVKPKHTKILLEGLNEKASLDLFCHHAFMSYGPKEGYEEVSKQVMAYCEGHPLALKVLGESLYNKNVAEWENCVIELKEEPNSCVMKALRMSYNSIQSKNDKELFLDIACFYVQHDRVFVETVLSAYGLRVAGIRNLIDRCLLTIGPDNIIVMHPLIIEMARDVILLESPDKPEERSRLWFSEDSFNVLNENKGTGNTKGLFLDMKMLENEMLFGSAELETSALSKMRNLKILKLNYAQLNGSWDSFPQSIRWLCMHGFPSKSIPLNLPMKNLVALDLSYSNIESFDMPCSDPQQPVNRLKVTGSCSKDKRFGSLKFLTLSFSQQLRSLGDLSKLHSLERLIVSNCPALTEICESIDQCVQLTHIELSYCKSLKRVPTTIGRLKKVKKLLLDGCDLSELPMKMKNVNSGKVFKDKILNINSQPSSSAVTESIQSDTNISVISLPTSLEQLLLANNNLSNESFPMDFSCLSMLTDLNLDGNPIVSLPDCVRTLPQLKTLSMSNCLKLMSVEHPPNTLKQLNLYNNCWEPDFKNLLRKIAFDPEMAPLELLADRNLLAPSSFEIEGMIQIQPMACVQKKLFRSLGWINTKFTEDKCMVTSYNYGRPEESQIQLYYEFGIFSTIYKAMRMPDWITHRSYRPSISFTIPSHHKQLRGLNFCIGGELFELPKIRIRNITKNLTWIYKHYIKSFSAGGESLVFLSHWMFGVNEMEVGDQITINLEKCSEDLIRMCGTSLVYDGGRMEEEDLLVENLTRFFIDSTGMYIKERDDITAFLKDWWGISVLDDGSIEKEDPLDYYKSWNHIIGGDLSAFQLATEEYFLHSVDFLRNLHSGAFANAHYKERTFLFKAFSPRMGNIPDSSNGYEGTHE